MQLTSIENTAWLTIYCRYLESKKKNSFLHDPFSEWFIKQKGTPDFIESIHKRVLIGVPVRSACFDDFIKEEIAKAGIGDCRVNYWALGCGFDSRWERFNKKIGKTIKEYCEFDFKNLLEYKKAIILASPYKAMYSNVKHFGGDFLKGLPWSIPETESPTLIVLEGVIMYFEKEDHIKLLKSIRERVPKATVFIDIYSAFAVRMANKRSEKSTGDSRIKFAWGPDNINDFFEQQEWKVKKSVSLIKKMFRKNKMFLRFLPLPEKIANSYMLVKVIPAKSPMIDDLTI